MRESQLIKGMAQQQSQQRILASERVNFAEVERQRRKQRPAQPQTTAQALASPPSVKLDTNEYVAEADFDKLSADDQTSLKKLGIKAFNESKQQEVVKAFEEANIKLDTGEYISKDDFNKLNVDDQASLKKIGVDEFNKVQQQVIDANYVKLSTGEYVSKEDYNKLDSDAKQKIVELGIDKFNKYMQDKPTSEYQAKITAVTPPVVPLASGTGQYKDFKGTYYIRTMSGDMPAWMLMPDMSGAYESSGGGPTTGTSYGAAYDLRNIRYAYAYPQRYEIVGWRSTIIGSIPVYKIYDEPWTEETWLAHIGATVEGAWKTVKIPGISGLGVAPREETVWVPGVKESAGIGITELMARGLYSKDYTYIDPKTGERKTTEGYVNPYGLYDTQGNKLRDIDWPTQPYNVAGMPESVKVAGQLSYIPSTVTGAIAKLPELVTKFMPEILPAGMWPTAVSSPAVLAAKLSVEELQKQIARGEIIKAKDSMLIPKVMFDELSREQQYTIRTEGAKNILSQYDVIESLKGKVSEDILQNLFGQALTLSGIDLGKLETFKTPANTYKIIDIIRDHAMPESDLVKLFGSATVQQANQFVSALSAVDKYKNPQTNEYDIIKAAEDARKDATLSAYLSSLFGEKVVKEANNYVDAKLAVEPYKDPKTEEYNILKAVKDARTNKPLEAGMVLLFGIDKVNEARKIVGYQDTLSGFNLLVQDFTYKDAKTGEVVGHDIVTALRSKDPQIKQAISGLYTKAIINEATKGKIIDPKNPVDKFNMWLDELSMQSERNITKGLVPSKDITPGAAVIAQTKPVSQMTHDEWFDYASKRFESCPTVGKEQSLEQFGYKINYTPEEKQLRTQGAYDSVVALVKAIPAILDPNEYANYTEDKYFAQSVKDKVNATWTNLPKSDKERLLSSIWAAPDSVMGKIEGTLRLEEIGKGITSPIVGAFAPLEDPIWVNDLRLRPESDPQRQAYVKQWKQDAISTGAFVASLSAGGIWEATGAGVKALIPALLYRNPITKFVVTQAVYLAQITFAAAPVLRTGSTISEALQASNLDRKWEVFQAQPIAEQDLWARKSGYAQPFNELTDTQKGHTLLTYTTPAGLSNEEWLKIIGEKVGQLQGYADKGSDWLAQKLNNPILAAPVQLFGGAAVGAIEGVGYVSMLPGLAAETINKVPEGTAADMTLQMAAQMTLFATQVIPEAMKARPALTAGRLFGLMVLSPKASAKLFGSELAGLSEKYVPKGAMAIEWETFRVEGKRLAIQAEMLDVCKEVVKKLISTGEPSVEVSVGGGVGVRIRNVPFQQVIGNALFHASPDRLKAELDGSIIIDKDTPLYTSPHMAERCLTQSYTGQPMKNPTLSVVLVPEDFIPKTEKVLGGGMLEPEHVLRDVILDPIPGADGKGISGSAYVGAFPIRYYTIRGESLGVEWKGISEIQYAQLRAMANKEAFFDFFLGWDGRRSAWKAMFGKDPKLEKLDAAIKQWNQRVPETTEGLKTATIYKGSRFIDDNKIAHEVDSYSFSKSPTGEWRCDVKTRDGKEFRNIPESDMILMSDRARVASRTFGEYNSPISKLRVPIEHPNGGLMRTTVGTVAITADGKIALATARGHETIPTVPGGGTHYIYYGGKSGGMGIESMQPPNLSHNYGRTYEEIARQTFKEELGLIGEVEYLGKYGGKRNEYSLPGSDIFVMKLKPNETIDTYRYPVGGEFRLPKDSSIKPELERVWLWDGHSKMDISPSGYDIVKAANAKYNLGYDLSKLEVKSEPGSDHVAKVRDTGFADRVAKGKELTNAELKHFEDLETKWLESARDKLLKGGPLGFKEWFTAETQYGTLKELIMGRRKAVSYFNELREKGIQEPQIVNVANQLNQLGALPAKAQGILSSKKAGQGFTPDEIATLITEISKNKPEAKSLTEIEKDAEVSRNKIVQQVPEVAPKVGGIIHRGIDLEAIKAGEQYGLSFDGMQEGAIKGEKPVYQFTTQLPEAKGITFYVEKLSDVPIRLNEKLTEFGIKPEKAINKVKLDTFKDNFEIPLEDGKATLVREMTADGMATAGFKLKINEGVDAWVNGEKVSGVADIKYGDHLMVGNNDIVFIPKEGSPAYFSGLIEQFDSAMMKRNEEAKLAEIDNQIKEYQKIEDKTAYEDYYENTRFYRDRYVGYLDKLTRAAAGQYREGEQLYDDISKIQDRYSEMYNEDREGQDRPYEVANAVPYDGRLDTLRREQPSITRAYLPKEEIPARPQETGLERVGLARVEPRRITTPTEPRRVTTPTEQRKVGYYPRGEIMKEPIAPRPEPYPVPTERIAGEPVIPPIKPPPTYTIPLPKIEEIMKRYPVWPPPGTISWRQGWCYKHIFPPWQQEDIFNTKKPLPEVYYATGVDSAYKSAVKTYGSELPSGTVMDRNMGLFRLHFVPGEKGKDPGVHFDLKEEEASWSPENVAERQLEEAQQLQPQQVVVTQQPQQMAEKETVAQKQPKPKRQPAQIISEPQIQASQPIEIIQPTKPKLDIFKNTTGKPFYDGIKNDLVFADQQRASGKVVNMSPDELIEKVSKLVNIPVEQITINATDRERIAKYISDGNKLEMPILDYQSGKQGGVLRAIVAKEMGIDEIPVFVVDDISKIQPEETQNIIPVDMEQWSASPAYRPAVQKPPKREARQFPEESIIMSR